MPNNINEDTPSQIYFNYISNNYDIKNRYIYNLDFTLDGVYLKLDLSVDKCIMLQIKTEIENFEKTTLTNKKEYGLAQFKDINLNLNNMILNISAHGNLHIVMLVPYDQMKEINSDKDSDKDSYKNSDKNSYKKDKYQSILNRITWDSLNNNFNFLSDAPVNNNANEPRGYRVNILV